MGHLESPGSRSLLEPVDTTNWYPKVVRKDYAVGLNITETAVDDPDPAFSENYVCGAQRNYTGYCYAEVHKTVAGMGDRKEIGRRRCVADIFYNRAANCWQPQVRGLG